MLWGSIFRVAEWAILAWFGLVFLAVIVQILSGKILFSGLIRARIGDNFDFGRVQMVAVTLFFAVGYAVIALGRPATEGMPEISPVVLAALLGSQSAYLGGKILAGPTGRPE